MNFGTKRKFDKGNSANLVSMPYSEGILINTIRGHDELFQLGLLHLSKCDYNVSGSFFIDKLYF